ncbi:single-stranded DNA-binding protein [Ornithinimicrobium sufpigmenti]|uniref:single-stranded DNA-binding protein n=1 Tax=Ornithinimicrobium sufpigmenti TaxID=2508882 RepID=UPI0010368313|nr:MULTISPECIES: single-stranded DNA-binding protein [unclassified Ornithinimicrobium]
MANETPITLVGRLTADPELRFTPSGAAVVNLNIACNERKFNKQTNEWEDGTPVFWRASAWRDLAERIAETLQKGHAVVAYGFVEGQTWQDKDTGKDRYGQQVQLQAIGPDLRWMTAQTAKATSSNNQGQQGGGWGGQQAQQQRPPAQQQAYQPQPTQQGGPRQQADQPWQQPQQQQAMPMSGGQAAYDEPPF